MPSFDTPEPISATIELEVGTARITAGKRTDTVVEVLPRNGSDDNDVRAVRQTQVTCSGGLPRSGPPGSGPCSASRAPSR